jgi:hypothetical protein
LFNDPTLTESPPPALIALALLLSAALFCARMTPGVPCCVSVNRIAPGGSPLSIQ